MGKADTNSKGKLTDPLLARFLKVAFTPLVQQHPRDTWDVDWCQYFVYCREGIHDFLEVRGVKPQGGGWVLVFEFLGDEMRFLDAFARGEGDAGGGIRWESFGAVGRDVER